jgi:hypothetical protein
MHYVLTGDGQVVVAQTLVGLRAVLHDDGFGPERAAQQLRLFEVLHAQLRVSLLLRVVTAAGG